MPHSLPMRLFHFALIFLAHVWPGLATALSITWPPYMHWTFCNYFTWNSFQLLFFPIVYFTEWSCCTGTREKVVIFGTGTGMCALWDVGRKAQKSSYTSKTKHRRHFIFLLTCNRAVASNLFLLFRCFQNTGYQFLAEIPAGLWLHDLELCTIKFHPFLFISILSDPAVAAWYFDPPLQRQCHPASCH